MELLLFISYLLLTISAVYSIVWIFKLLKRKIISGYLFLIPVFLTFYVVPILTDYLTEIPFDNYSLIFKAMNDRSTSILYNLYATFINILLIYFAKKKSNKIDILQSIGLQEIKINTFLINLYRNYKFLIWLLLILPLIMFLFSDKPDYYYYYLGRSYDYKIPEIHNLLSKLSLLSVIIASFLVTVFLSSKKYSNNNNILLLPFVFIIVFVDFWFHGKRSVVAIFLLCLLMLLIITKVVSVKKILRISIIILFFFIVFLQFYGKNISDDKAETYNAFRTDFSRDYGVKFVIYNDLLNNRPILPQRFSSVIFNLTFFVPREIWPDKPQPYAVYFTNSAFGNFGEDKLYGWGLTTSIFAESISNFGFLGLFIAPLILLWIIKKGEKSSNPIFKLLSILISIMLLLVEPIAFMILILIFFILMMIPNKRMVWK